MSVMTREKRPSLIHLLRKKQQGEKIVSLTCYDYSTARILDETDLDFLLVGDSLAMTQLGHENTLSISVDEMLHHVKAVSRGAFDTWIVADMPFMSYHVDKNTAIVNAGRFIQEGGAHSVKVEGASPFVLVLIEHLTSIGIPVMGHIGFTPQAVHALGGFRVQGRSIEKAKRLLQAALALQSAGAYAVVLEMVPSEVATIITQQLRIPTIGIGAGNGCDGQILVIDDFLGRYPDMTPRFSRRYVDSTSVMQEAIATYCQDVSMGSFPDSQTEAFPMESDMLPELYAALAANPMP